MSTENAQNALHTTSLKISGMSCAACAARIEKGLEKLPGVASAVVNFASEKATVSYDPAQVSLKEFAAKIDKDFTGNITIGTYPYWYYGEFGLSSIILTKYDLPYFDYYVTRREGDMNDDVFAISGNNIAWNIKGDGIGLFIGSNKKEIILK